MDLKVFITVSQKMPCLIGVRATVHISKKKKKKKKTVKILTSDQIAFAAMVILEKFLVSAG